MKARIFALDSDEHRKAQELLPWFVSGTLGEAERAEVARHVDECIRCQTDAAEIADIRSLGPAPASKSLERDWSVLLRRIHGERAALRPAMAQPRAHRSLQIALVLQAAIILVLALALIRGAPRSEPYRTLGARSDAGTANAVVVFAADATQAQMADALRAAKARIVEGPTTSGAYLLHLESPRVLAALRVHAGVQSAVSLDASDSK
jgi:hypothetical protein